MVKGGFALALASAALANAAAAPAKIQARASSTASGGALPTVTQRGNAFWAGNDRFYVRGIDYQPGGSSGVAGSSGASDPLADETTCKRDIAEFQKLGLNTVRVYTVDNTKNHDVCMSALAAAGMYLALDVNTPNYSLDRGNPGPSYNPTYLQSIFATIDAFAGYSNLLVFFSGNEVINDPTTIGCAPYVKAVNRDMKQYIGERGYRAIPVGYSAADVSENQYLMAQYMDCGEDAERSDFYAINNYEWCGHSSFETSGWQILTQQYANYSKPLFFSEYGCIKPARYFEETVALYQPDMVSVFSGGLVYEYSNEGNGFGIVDINGDSITPVDNQVSLLASALSAAPTPSGDGGYNSGTAAQPCPALQSNWAIKPWSNSAIPAMPSGAQQYMKNGAGTGPGLAGDGSQNAPGGSTETAAPGAGSVTATYGSGPTGSTGSTGDASAATSTGAASSVHAPPMDFAPLVCGAIVIISTLFGAALL